MRVRAPPLKGGGLFAPISREGALVLNNLLLSCGCATVLLGTLYPLFLDAVGGRKLSVGLAVLQPHLRAADGADAAGCWLGPLLAWKRGDLLGALQRLWAAYIAAAVVVLVAFYVTPWRSCTGGAGFGLAAWLVAAVLVEWAERVRLFRMPLAPTACAVRSICRVPPMA